MSLIVGAFIRVLLPVLVMVSALAGCAGTKQFKPVIENAAEERTERERELIENFSQRRDDAQYQAALQSWESGDPKGCRELIEKLLERNPKHKQARQLLADLHLDGGSPQEAKELLEQLLAEFPNDAQIHHSLGMLHETMADNEAALRHLGRAVELDPENELYHMCHETAVIAKNRTRGLSGVHEARRDNCPRPE